MIPVQFLFVLRSVPSLIIDTGLLHCSVVCFLSVVGQPLGSQHADSFLTAQVPKTGACSDVSCASVCQ